MNLINQPYPYLHQGHLLLRNCLLLLVVGFLFEYFIIPFQRTPSEHLYAYWIISLFHIGTATLIYLIYFIVLSPFVNADDWKVYKEVLALFFLLFFIGVGEWLIRDLIYDNPNNWRFELFKVEVWHAFLSGSVILILVTTINYNFLSRRNLESASKFEIKKAEGLSSNQEVHISTAVKGDDFVVIPANLACVKSDGNYSDFFIRENGSVKKLVKRISLQNVEEQLEVCSFVVRTHRAFLVNINTINKVSGNAAGYQLQIDGLNFQVPVSRAHIANFNEKMS